MMTMLQLAFLWQSDPIFDSIKNKNSRVGQTIVQNTKLENTTLWSVYGLSRARTVLPGDFISSRHTVSVPGRPIALER